jgi:CheY-like chemotaxis protein
MRRVILIHYDAEEAEERAGVLRRAKYAVEVHAPRSSPALRPIMENPPEAFVVDLSRRPSDGHGVAVTLRQRRATRHVPIVLVGGEPEKVARLRAQLPDVSHSEWRGIREVLSQALRQPPKEPHVPGTMAAYTSTPLSKKLGIRAGFTVALLGAPKDFGRQLGKVRKEIKVKTQARGGADVVMLFVKSRSDLAKRLPAVKRMLSEGGWIWVAWPKKTSKTAGDLTQVSVRKIGMTGGLVDYKICAIDETWSGLRFARREGGRERKGGK